MTTETYIASGISLVIGLVPWLVARRNAKASERVSAVDTAEKQLETYLRLTAEDRMADRARIAELEAKVQQQTDELLRLKQRLIELETAEKSLCYDVNCPHRQKNAV